MPDDEPTYGAWAFTGSAPVALELARSELDWVLLDQQHGRFDDEKVLDVLDRARPADKPVYVRARALDAGLIGRALDAGAAGVVVPMIEDPEQARRLVEAALYPPLGRRSWGPIGSVYGSPGDSAAEINGRTTVGAMIETAGSLELAARIAEVPGIDLLFVGPFDLALALGTDVDSLLSDDAADAPLRRIARAAHDAGIAAGAFAGTTVRARRLRELGYTFLAVTSDTAALGEAANAAAARMRA